VPDTFDFGRVEGMMLGLAIGTLWEIPAKGCFQANGMLFIERSVTSCPTAMQITNPSVCHPTTPNLLFDAGADDR